MWFSFLEITNIRQKSQDFWFADLFLEIFKIYRLVWISQWICGRFECVSSMFCLKLLQILNFTNAVLSKTPSEAFRLAIGDRLGPMTLQLTKSRDLRQNYLCDFHLWALMKRHLKKLCESMKKLFSL